MKLLRRIRYLLRRRALERDLEEEMSAHRETLAADRKASFGSGLKLREESRDAWGWTWFDELRQDLAYGARQLRRSPGFACTAVVVLALGIGAPLAMFNVVNAAMFHWLAARDADSLIEYMIPASSAMVDFFRDHNSVFSYVVAERSDSSVFMEDRLEPERSVFVSAGYFTDLGITPSVGRVLDPHDADPGAPPVVVLGYSYWQSNFGSDTSVAGRVVHLNGQPVQIAGVLSPEFNGLSNRGEPPALWLPIATHPYLFVGSRVPTDFGLRDTQMYAKLKPGISLPAADAQLASLIAELRRQHPDQIQPRETPHGQPLLSLPHDAFAPLAMVTLLVVAVLITACANLGNILLARGQTRMREIGIRVSLGAGGSRIVRQLMVENLLLAALGASGGLAVGYVAAKSLLRAADASPSIHLATDWRMLLAGISLALVAASLFGLAPAIQAARRNVRPTQARKVLVAVQVAASCFLLILASVLTLSARRQFDISVRYDYRHMLVIDPRLNGHGLTGPAARQALDEIATRLEQLPGVQGVTSAEFTPFSGPGGFPDYRPGLPRITYNQVAPTYFELMNLALVRGRLFSANEPAVAVISESTARTLWPTDDPVGKTLSVPKFSIEGSVAAGRAFKGLIGGREQRTVIGIVKDSGKRRAVNPLEGYWPITDANVSRAAIILRTAGDPAGIIQNARSAASLPGLVPAAWLLRTWAEQEVGPPPGVLLALGSLSATATSLAAVGIFGLIAFAVAQRTREIGVRMALGARASDVLGTLLAQYSVAMSAGAAAGIFLALTVGLLIRSAIIGVDPLDPLGYATGLAIFAMVALVAILIPARRALRIDPASALRWE